MIEKVIHYCWFGGTIKPLIVERCIHSWKTCCPDYEIIEWNEFNSRQFSNKYYRQALRKNKYAFAADYIRFCVLEKYGGVYLDTDMTLIKNIDHLLNYDFFIGKEDEQFISFGIFGCKKNSEIMNLCKSSYGNDFDYINPITIPELLSSKISKNIENRLNCKIFSSSVFYPIPYSKRLDDYSKYIQNDTLAIHLWNHSWINVKKTSIIKKMLVLIIDFLFFEYNFSFFKKHSFFFLKKWIDFLKKKLVLINE